MRKLIDQVKNFGNSLNENAETEPKTVKEIMGILTKNNIKVSSGEDFYNGSGYAKKYTVIDSDDVDGKTAYLGIPVVMRSVVWQQVALIRWKRVEIDALRFNKVLQQLWKGDLGEQEWRDVPEED